MLKFVEWWNHLPEYINPVLFELGPVQIRWYGLMYLLSFLVAYSVLLYRRKYEDFNYSAEHVEDYLIWGILGAFIGARLGYVLFYDFWYFVQNPLEIFWPFKKINGGTIVGLSGLSYHGGLIGLLLSTFLFCRRRKFQFWPFVDFAMPAVPLGYTFGRIGNFLNGELYGRVTDFKWGMYFPQALTYELRHASQLYEAFFEGIFLFFILWNIRNKKAFDGYMFWVYLMGYGLVRFFIEFVRQPDEHLGFVLFSLTMGQVLCLVMVVVGYLVIVKYKKKRSS